MAINHVHGYIRVQHPRLLAVLAFFHLPFGWLVKSGDLPHDAECTDEWAVLKED